MLRSNMTKAEACLWKYALRARQMKGYTFRRQRPVLNYVADFMCKELHLIIEVDGITHTQEDTKIKDSIKETDLESVGFRIIRFTDEAILNNINGVIDTLEILIDKMVASNPPPFNSPANGGQFHKT
jgi:very-short-patch-repair endonuclease